MITTIIHILPGLRGFITPTWDSLIMILTIPICIITTMTHGTMDPAYTWVITGGTPAGLITDFP